MKYPKEIYWDNFIPGITPTRQKSLLVERAYDMGKADAKSLDGYSNLTEAISAGEPIDWERLDGLKVQCVNPDVGTNGGVLKRELGLSAQSPFGWWNTGADISYTTALVRAWDGRDGWTLWVEGEVPLRRKTADQLKRGTYFLGEALVGGPDLVYVGGRSEASKVIYYAPEMLKSVIPAADWVVLEEHGTFQKPEGE